MARILIVEGNSEALIARNEASGRKQAWRAWADALLLHEPGAEFQVAFPYAPGRDRPFGAPDEWDAFVLTGSAVAWSAAEPEAIPYIDFIAPMLATGKPVLGCCWGIQTAATALGGAVGSNPLGSEVGVARGISLTGAGETDPLFAGSPRSFASVTWHRDHVTRAPAGAVILAENAISPIQAMVVRGGGVDFFGVQYHPEAELADFRLGFERSGLSPGAPGVNADFPDDPPAEVADPALRTLAVRNWLSHVEKRAAGRES